MSRYTGPLLTRELAGALRAAFQRGETAWQSSLNLGRHQHEVGLSDTGFDWQGQQWPWPDVLKDRTIYWFDGEQYSAVQQFGAGLIKLVPTDWGAPTFEIDGIKMLPTSQVSPWDDAATKVALIAPRGKHVLDCCGGLGYFAANALAAGASTVTSFEKNPDVLWLRERNPWSPEVADPAHAGRFSLTLGDVSQQIAAIPDAAFDAALHDPPRFGIAGELYSQAFYDQLARVLKPRAPLFHYTGTPNAKTSGRDVPGEVIKRLQKAGFKAERKLDGVLAERTVRR